MARLESVSSSLVLDYLHLESFLLLHSPARVSSAALASSLVHVGVTPTLRLFAQLDFTFLFFGMAHLGFLSLALDYLHLGLLLPSRSFARCGALPLVVDFLHLDLSPLSRSCTCLEFLATVLGLACLDFVFSPSVSDHLHLGSSSLSHSFTRTGPFAPATDLLRLAASCPFGTWCDWTLKF